jgi:ABC-2 type transport system ATP-binding protein
MLMKAALLSSLAYRPQLLVLDEPFSGLDPGVRDEFIRGVLEVSALGEWTVLVSSHDIDEVERLADHVALLDAGRLRLSERAEELQARFRRVEVSGATGRDGAAAAPAGNGNAIALERAGALLRFVETAYGGEASERVWREHFGAAATVRAQPMTLREIFMALAREGRDPAVNEPPAAAVAEASA